MRSVRQTIFGFLGILLLVAASACNAADEQAADPPDAEDPAGATEGGTGGEPTGGDLVVVVAGVDSENFDPALFQSSGQHTFYPLVFDALIGKDPETGELTPKLATEWQVAEDGTSWIINLRQGVTFHNGEEFTAEDAQFSIERYIGEYGEVAAVGSERMAAAIDAVEIVDDYTIAIRSSGGAPTIPFDLSIEPGAASGYMVPKDYVEEVGDEEFNLNPVGTGPFRFVSQDQGREMKFERNAEYWDTVASVDTLTLQLVPELSARLALLQSGEADIVSGIVGPAIPQVTDDPNTTVASSEMGHIVYLMVGGMTNSESPLSDARVRRAIALAVDREAIVDGLLHGQGMAASIFGFPFSVGWPDDASNYTQEYDPDAASSLLEEAGTGALSLSLFAATEGRDFAQAIAQNLRAINVEVDLQVLEVSSLIEELTSDSGKESTRLVLVFGPHGSPARIDIGSVLHTQFHPGSALSQPNGDETLAAAVEAQLAEMDQEARSEMIRDIIVTNYEQVYNIPLWYVNTIFAAGPSVVEGSWTPIPGMGYPLNLESVQLAN